MILETTFLVIIFLVIIWKGYEFTRDRKKADTYTTSHLPNKESLDKKDSKTSFDVVTSKENEEEEKRPLWLRLTPIILGWMVFILSILELHPQLWRAWYGDGGLGLPLFWIAQALFVLLLLAFHKHKVFFYILITTAVAVSFWSKLSEKLIEEGLVKEDKTIVLHPTQRKWKLCWKETNITRKHPRDTKEPCLKNSKKVVLFVSIKEYNSVRFTFSVSWKEHRLLKERSVFYWDKIKSQYGTWHRNGSSRKDKGRWYLEKENDNLFIGWITSDSDGQMHPLTLHAL